MPQNHSVLQPFEIGIRAITSQTKTNSNLLANLFTVLFVQGSPNIEHERHKTEFPLSETAQQSLIASKQKTISKSPYVKTQKHCALIAADVNAPLQLISSTLNF